MFTGIVRSVGEAESVERVPSGMRIRVRSPYLADAEIGGSVACAGVCLTVTERQGDLCSFDVAPETLARTTLARLRPGDRLNIERPLRPGDEMGGHVVQGHVDGAGVVTHITDDERGRRLRIDLGTELARYVAEKGSVAIDGVSLTVTAVGPDAFEVMLILHTLDATTLGRLREGDPVNLEVDVLAKYVERLLERSGAPAAATEDLAPDQSGYL